MSVDLEAVVKLGTEPIPGDSPTGRNVQGEDGFQQCEEMFRRITADQLSEPGQKALDQEDPPEWSELVEAAMKILAEDSKHLRPAAYVVIGSFQEEGLPGLAAGLKLIDGMLANFWENLYPPRKLMKGRTSSLEFMATYIAGKTGQDGGLLAIRGNRQLAEWKETAGGMASSADYEELVALHKGLEESLATYESIKKQVYELFPQDWLPTIASLKDALTRLERTYREEVRNNKPPEPRAQPTGAGEGGEDGEEGGEGGAATPAAPSPVVRRTPPSDKPRAAAPSAPEEIEGTKEIFAFLRRAAPVLREADPAGAAAYRLLRMGVWGGVQTAPPIKEGQATRVPKGAINDALIESYGKLLEAQNWVNLLGQAEGRFPNAPFWLDLQFYVHAALRGMGPAYVGAAAAVVDELGLLLDRVKGIEELEFAEGVPFAGAETRQWIDSEVRNRGDGGGGGPARATAGSGGGEELAKALAEAKPLAAQGKVLEAMRLLESGPSRNRGDRARFQWRAALARLLLDARKPKLAQPMLEGLMKEIDRHALETWEPELCCEVLEPLYLIMRSDKAQEARASEVFDRLCRVDMEAALRLDKG